LGVTDRTGGVTDLQGFGLHAKKITAVAAKIHPGKWQR
jgi:hypothetical protein